MALAPSLFVALPSYDGRRHNATAMVDLCGIRNLRVRFQQRMSSLLALGFNQAWAEALNLQADFFLMLHEDVIPRTYQWPAVLFQEMGDHGADVVSVVSPIKTIHGITSTALETEDAWNPRRLTMTEIMERPETWTEPELLVNTGCMLVDMRKPWVHEMYFTINDRIILKDGEYIAEVQPEDWNFSRAAKAAGAKLIVTRKVAIDHVGRAAYTNDGVWGSETTDPVPQEATA